MHIADHQRLTSRFFRDVNSVELFRRFFGDFGVWDSMGLGPHPLNGDIFPAWEKLDCPRRSEIQEDLCRINDIGREKGRFALQNRARDCEVEGFEDLSLPKLAMILYLDHRRVFDEAYNFFTLEKADNLHTLLGRSPVPCEPTREQVEAFKARLSTALRFETEGPKLTVEVESRHPDKWMAAIPHQTYVKPDHEFGDHDEIITRDRRPIYEMVLIYYPATGVLKLKAGRGRRKVEQVAWAFATEVLGQDAGFFQVCEIINFQPLLDPRFAITPEPRDHFEWARPTMVRFAKHSDLGTEYQVNAKDLPDGAPGVLAILEKDGISLSEIEILALTICFKFPKSRRDTRTVELALPNRSSLDETERDRYIERVLTRLELINHEAKNRLARAGLSLPTF